MDLSLRSYFFSPLNTGIGAKLQDHDHLLDIYGVETQTTRLSDISTTFRMALRDQSKASLLLLAEALRSNTQQLPLNYETDMNVEHLSTLHTISFTHPRLDPTQEGDFCVYFSLESSGSETFVTDLALFIRTLGQRLNEWSVYGRPNRFDPGDPAHPVLRDIVYCWDGIACGHGVIQFSADVVSVMNIRRMFHRTSRIFGAICQHHRYEYLASGVFLDVESAVLPLVFTEMETAAQELCDNHALFEDITDRAKHIPY